MHQTKTDYSIQLSGLDRLILGIDRAVRTLSPGSIAPARVSPAGAHEETAFRDRLETDTSVNNSSVANDTNIAADSDANHNDEIQQHIGGLMRINHTGEVCAQALYQGQALTARNQLVRDAMQESADEEEDHLAWCEERLLQLDSRTSYLNPLFYGLSFGIGALAGAAGDKWSLGFIAATEEQVCQHLRAHLEQIPESDRKSRAILSQMLEDEEQHGEKALQAGGIDFSPDTKKMMTALSKWMTETTYKI